MTRNKHYAGTCKSAIDALTSTKRRPNTSL